MQCLFILQRLTFMTRHQFFPRVRHFWIRCMLRSIDNCQNRVSAEQYHLTLSRAQVSTPRGLVFFDVIRWQVTSFQMIAGSSLFFLNHMKYVVFYMCRTIKILILNWPRKLKCSQFLQAGKTCQLLLTFLTKVTRWSRSTSKFLCSDWSKFYRWVHAENLRSILKLVYFDSWSSQRFVSTCDVFNCLFPLNVQNEIQLLSRVLCYSWLVCLLGFWLRNTSLVKVANPISDGIVFVFHLAWCVRGL